MNERPRDPPSRPPAPDSGPGEFQFTLRWAVKQFAKVILLGLLILFAMREADLDARNLEELRARRNLLSVLAEGQVRSEMNAATYKGDVNRYSEAYLATCGECASRPTCEQALRDVLNGSLGSDAKGPCKEPMFGPWLRAEPAGARARSP